MGEPHTIVASADEGVLVKCEGLLNKAEGRIRAEIFDDLRAACLRDRESSLAVKLAVERVIGEAEKVGAARRAAR